MKQITLLLTTLFLTFGMFSPSQAQNCIADFTYLQNPLGNNSPLQFEFTNTSSTPNGLSSYLFTIEQIISPSDTIFYTSFNIGGPGAIIYHNFSAPGDFLVSLKMIDSTITPPVTYCSDIATYLIIVDTPICMATFDTTQVSIDSNGNYTVTFEATSLMSNGANNVYDWSFGDGATATGNPVTHTFQGRNSYNVTLNSSDNNCNSTLTKEYLFYNCAGFQASYTISPLNGYTYTFTNTSTLPSGSPSTAWVSGNWNFGDGNFAAVSPSTNHTYSQSGTYTTEMMLYLTDTLPNGDVAFCIDSASQTLTVNSPNEIKGFIFANDSMLTSPSYTYKIWLIQYDSVQDWLYAVDSQIINGNSTGTPYEFTGHAPGFYYVKAHEQSGQLTSNNEVMLPTYHISSLNWTSANQVIHGGGTTWASIQMLAGNNYSGPGFIGGNVSQGANRSTGEGNGVAGVVGLDVFLIDQNNSESLFYTTTDERGQFTFEDIPFGTYEIYPEALNYNTTPAIVDINGENPVSDANDFEQTSDAIQPDGSTGIIDNDIAEFKLYPNPVIDQLTIESDATVKIEDIRIWDNQGRTVFHSPQPHHSIDLSALPEGFYYIRVTNTSGGVHMQKFVKQSR